MRGKRDYLKKLIIHIGIYILCLINISICYAQADSLEDKNKRVTHKFAGGPGYSPELGVILANNLISTFKFKEDKISEPSIVPLSFILYIGENIGYKLYVKPRIFLKEGDIQIFGTVQHNNLYENYFGIGYNTNYNTTQGENTTLYHNSNFLFNGVINHRIKSSNWFLGGQLNFSYNSITKPSEGVINDAQYMENGGTDSGLKVFNSGAGVNLSYDTRDVISNTYNGKLFKFDYIQYSKILGGEYNYGNLQLEYRQYASLSKHKEGRILAWMLSSNSIYGNAPFIDYPTVGSAYDLRGYYMGQYRDKATSMAIVEYRHKFNTTGSSLVSRIVNSLGFVTWAGIGVIGENLVNVNGVLPNFGGGLRVRIQERLNFRFDLGYNPINKDIQVYFGVFEAF